MHTIIVRIRPSEYPIKCEGKLMIMQESDLQVRGARSQTLHTTRRIGQGGRVTCVTLSFLKGSITAAPRSRLAVLPFTIVEFTWGNIFIVCFFSCIFTDYVGHRCRCCGERRVDPRDGEACILRV